MAMVSTNETADLPTKTKKKAPIKRGVDGGDLVV
jgi:hypothetical protein